MTFCLLEIHGRYLSSLQTPPHPHPIGGCRGGETCESHRTIISDEKSRWGQREAVASQQNRVNVSEEVDGTELSVGFSPIQSPAPKCCRDQLGGNGKVKSRRAASVNYTGLGWIGCFA